MEKFKMVYDSIINLSKANSFLGETFSHISNKDKVNVISNSLMHDIFISDKNISFPNISLSKTNGSSVVAEDLKERKIKRSVKTLISLIKTEDYVEGEITKSQIYLESLLAKDKTVFLETFQQTWVRLFGGDPFYLRTFICISANLSYEVLKDRADVLIVGACNNSDAFVQEAAIRAIESWGNSKHADLLKNMRRFEEDWLEDYKKSIMELLGA